MLRAVQLYCQFFLCAIKIYYILPYYFLSAKAKLQRVQKPIPQFPLLLCHIFSQIASIRSQFRVIESISHLSAPLSSSPRFRSAPSPQGEGLIFASFMASPLGKLSTKLTEEVLSSIGKTSLMLDFATLLAEIAFKRQFGKVFPKGESKNYCLFQRLPLGGKLCHAVAVMKKSLLFFFV